ncbi:hypothetical protein [Frigoriglobus tundricola]|uniref:Uncharacterized protein n=1 Tax=Frigoriglobus tundricola TaxID=2774151 RepID=A0A6M5YGQ6_9BACT|nr:hypothetical protein [Frigoriglobus tundricola]QJW93217.1 hypothetical protein FTUN_0722 [Frigoriglobus tundricola]
MNALVAAIAFQSLLTFSLDVRVVDAIEGGPLLLEVTATYTGTHPLRVWSDPTSSPFEVEFPREWPVFHRPQQRQLFSFGPAPGFVPLRRGDKKTARIAVHKLVYGEIPAGPAVIRLKYSVRAELGGREACSVVISRPVRVEIGRCSEHFVQTLRADIARSVSSRNAERLAEQADRVLGTHHPQFAAIGAELLLVTRDRFIQRELREFLRESPEGTRKLHDWDTNAVLSSNDRILINEIFEDWANWERPRWVRGRDALDLLLAAICESPKYGADERVIVPLRFLHAVRLWRGFSQQLPDEYCIRLQGIKSLWLRAYVGATFGNRLPKEWMTRLESDLRARVTPLSEKQINEWIGQLDDGAFSVREAATEQLLLYFDRTKPLLIKAFSGEIPPEAALRISDILKRGKDPKQEPLRQDFLTWVSSLDSRSLSCRRMVATLAAGDPNLELVREAKAIQARPK